MKRRDLLVFGGIIAGIASVQAVIRRWPASFEFSDIKGLPDFRVLELGAASLVADPLFVGLERPSDEARALQDQVRAAPCPAVFGPPTWSTDKIPLTVFSDYYCPNCPALSRTVRTLEREGAPIHVRWTDLPILGPRSEDAARLALAAQQQDAHGAAHDFLMSRPVPPGPVGARIVAEALGLDSTRLAADAHGPKTQEQLDQANAIAAVFGIFGTPATLVGRTLVIGRIEKRDLNRLIRLEIEEGAFGCS